MKKVTKSYEKLRKVTFLMGSVSIAKVTKSYEFRVKSYEFVVKSYEFGGKSYELRFCAVFEVTKKRNSVTFLFLSVFGSILQAICLEECIYNSGEMCVLRRACVESSVIP